MAATGGGWYRYNRGGEGKKNAMMCEIAVQQCCCSSLPEGKEVAKKMGE